jgi:hypothetical protein
MVISSTLGYSPRPPVSDMVRAHSRLTSDAFLGSRVSAAYTHNALALPLRVNGAPDFPKAPSYSMHGAATASASLTYSVPPLVS